MLDSGSGLFLVDRSMGELLLGASLSVSVGWSEVCSSAIDVLAAVSVMPTASVLATVSVMSTAAVLAAVSILLGASVLAAVSVLLGASVVLAAVSGLPVTSVLLDEEPDAGSSAATAGLLEAFSASLSWAPCNNLAITLQY